MDNPSFGLPKPAAKLVRMCGHFGCAVLSVVALERGLFTGAERDRSREATGARTRWWSKAGGGALRGRVGSAALEGLRSHPGGAQLSRLCRKSRERRREGLRGDFVGAGGL